MTAASRRALAATTVVLAALAAQALMAQAGGPAPTPPGERRQFVACPIVRDTKTQPCWLAEYQGETYYLGQQGGVANDFHPPQLGHQALVEGTVGQGRVCGGIPLQTVKVSVLRELAPACNTMLPAEDGIEAPPPIPSPRTPGPSWVKQDGPGDVTLYFTFDSDFFSLHITNALTSLATHVAQTKASRVEVTGYRAASRLSHGELLTEHAQMGQIRARKVAETLGGLGVPASALVVSASPEAERADGINDPWKRRVRIQVK